MHQTQNRLGKLISLALVSVVCLSFCLPAVSANDEKAAPIPDFDFTLPLYLGKLDADGQRSVILYLHFDNKGVDHAEYVPVKLEQERFVALPPNERATALAEIVARFPQPENSPWRAQTVFWNGTEWQSAPALAYVRDARSDNWINLPIERTIQVRDLSGESGGFATGKAIEDFAAEPQTDERISLSNGKLQIWRPHSNGEWQMLWESKPSWKVMQFGFGDADEDGRPEIIFTLWKNDGPDDQGQYRSHPFVYGWRRDAIRPVWAGSALVDPIREFALSNFAQSGTGPTNQLVVLEGSYDDAREAPARSVTVWQWIGWGYELLWRGPPGAYSSLRYIPGQPYAFFKLSQEKP